MISNYAALPKPGHPSASIKPRAVHCVFRPRGPFRIRIGGLGSVKPSRGTELLAIAKGLRTATPAINDGKWRYSATLSEYRQPFLNGAQRSVNRKVQGSNPWSRAKSDEPVRRNFIVIRRIGGRFQGAIKGHVIATARAG